ncbi:energy transducer TonB [Thermodesulfobacteriota bacterium]
MRVPIIISFIFHAILILGLHKTLDINWFAEPLPVFHVELIRPPVDPLDDKSIAGADLERKKSEEENKKSEDTISLDTKDKRYVSYAKIIKERLQQNWQYPVKAKENLIEGQVLVIFSLDRNGNLISIKILQPSQFDILNEETQRVIKFSAPFPSFPGSVTVKRLNVKANFAYRLKSS